MQVPDRIRQCVAFVAHRTNADKPDITRIRGTAFFVVAPIYGQQMCIYAVTARHCVEDVAKSSCDSKLLLRVNTKAGGTRLIETNTSNWTFHDSNERVDVAIHRVENFDELEHLCIPLEMFSTANKLVEEWIGIGDEIFVTGLFKHHTGRQRNIPIVRVGNIAAMPEEKVKTQRYGDMDALLIECRSIGGLSGSPVFAKMDDWERMLRNGKPGQVFGIEQPKRERGGKYTLIGLIHGHWDEPSFAVEDLSEKEQLNTGIAIVVPADDILVVIKSAVVQNRLASGDSGFEYVVETPFPAELIWSSDGNAFREDEPETSTGVGKSNRPNTFKKRTLE